MRKKPRTTKTAGGHPKTTAHRYAFIGPASFGQQLDSVASQIGVKHRGAAIRALLLHCFRELESGDLVAESLR